MAKITAVNAVALTKLRDRKAAGVLVQSLRSDPTIESAQILTADDDSLAHYQRNEDRQEFSNPDAPSENAARGTQRLRNVHGPAFPSASMFDAVAVRSGSHGSHVDITAPIRLDDEIIGFVYIQASLEQLYSTLASYAAIAVLVRQRF